MGLLVLDRAQLEVRAESGALALYDGAGRRGTVPVALVDRCVIHGARTRLDTGVLMQLAESGATTVLMSPRQTRRVAIVLGPWHNDAAVRLAQGQAVMDHVFCTDWACHIVRAKLIRQRRTLQRMLTQRPDARKALFDALSTLTASVAALERTVSAAGVAEGADAIQFLATLRGVEGAAARAYFGGLAGVMPPALGFQGRNRRPPRDPVNACLSLGYMLMHTIAVHACTTAGLDPLLGFYHRPAVGRESLASDLIEPLRAAVDEWAWDLLRERKLREDHFTSDKGACLLGKAGRDVFYGEWEQAALPWRRWLRLRAMELARMFRNRGIPLLAPVTDEEDEP